LSFYYEGDVIYCALFTIEVTIHDMSVVIKLLELQELEIEIAALEKAITEARSNLGESQALKKARVDAVKWDNHLRQLTSRQKDLELQSQELDAKLKNVNEKLYSGRVTNPKELTNLQQEADLLGTKAARVDEETIAVMEQTEKASDACKQSQHTLKEEEDSSRIEQKKLKEEIEDMLQKLGLLKQRHAQMSGEIPPQVLQQYERIKMQKGIAVARVSHGSCGGCRINLSTSQLQRVRNEPLERCANCGRILFSE